MGPPAIPNLTLEEESDTYSNVSNFMKEFPRQNVRERNASIECLKIQLNQIQNNISPLKQIKIPTAPPLPPPPPPINHARNLIIKPSTSPKMRKIQWDTIPSQEVESTMWKNIVLPI